MEMLKAFITTSPQYAGLLESTLEAMNQENITPQDLLLTIQELATESLVLEDFNKCKGCTNMKLTVMQQDELSEEEFSEENSNESDSSGVL